MKLNLNQEIRSFSDLLIKTAVDIPIEQRTLKAIDGTGRKISVGELIAYQIGWGKNLIRWYEAGVQKKKPEMPGDGFTKWNYRALAHYFYENYLYDGSIQQIEVFQKMVCQILEIIEKEEPAGNLDKEGVWNWCNLSSGKKWPLRKWILINTVSPYKRAIQLIKKAKFLK